MILRMNIKQPLLCPTCSQTIYWTDEYAHKPFCSERCRLIDLGHWVEERYKFETEETEETVPSSPE